MRAVRGPMTWAEAVYYLACVVEVAEARRPDAAGVEEFRRAVDSGRLREAFRAVQAEREALLKRLAGGVS